MPRISCLSDDYVEARLQVWGKETRSGEVSGYPTRWVTERMRLGGLTKGSPLPPTTLSEAVAIIDAIIAKMPMSWQKVAKVNWQYPDQCREIKAQRARLPERTFRRRVTVIRQTVKFELNL